MFLPAAGPQSSTTTEAPLTDAFVLAELSRLDAFSYAVQCERLIDRDESYEPADETINALDRVKNRLGL
jgi:hypothetical protein